MDKAYFKRLLSENPRFWFLAALTTGLSGFFMPALAIWSIFFGHLAWSDLKRNPATANHRRPWLVGVLGLGYVLGLPRFIAEPVTQFEIQYRRSQFLAACDEYPGLIKWIAAAAILIASPVLLLLARAFVCWCIGTWGLDEKLDESRSAMKKEMEILRAENKAILVKLDEIKGEILAARAKSSPESGTSRLIVP